MLKLRMRTKFLLSMLLISAGLTCTSLLLVRHNVQKQVKRELFADLRNSVITFQNFQRERELTLSHSAELLADLPTLRALMTTQHEATIQDASSDLWRLAGNDLFVAYLFAGPDARGGPAIVREKLERRGFGALVVWRATSLRSVSEAHLLRTGS
jgi:hypothetical protein